MANPTSPQPYDITERKLKREFERYGTIRQVKLVHERSGRIDELAEDQANAKSRGYAFVEFDREKDMKGNGNPRLTLTTSSSCLCGSRWPQN